MTNIHEPDINANGRSGRRALRGTSTQGASDAELVSLVRDGDNFAFGELWNRHSPAGIAAARSITSRFDPEDLAAEAFTRILHSIKDGKGPRVAFRPYLYTTIRNISMNWARDRGHEIPSDDVDAFASVINAEDEALDKLEQSTSNKAYNSLPTRWQEALWYAEVEGLSPRHIAPLLGMKAGAVSALLFRARAGLREAWIQAHLHTLSADSACRWVVDNLAGSTRSSLSKRDQEKVNAHLPGCASCTLIAGEAEQLNSRLALVLLPLAIGIPGTAGFAAWLQSGDGATAVASALPAGIAAQTGLAAQGGNSVTASAGIGSNVLPAVAAAAAIVVVSAGAVFGITQLSGSPDAAPEAIVEPLAAQPPPVDAQPEVPAAPPAPAPLPPPAPVPAPVPEPSNEPDPQALEPEISLPPVTPPVTPPVKPPVKPPVDTVAEPPSFTLGDRDPGRGPREISGMAEPGAQVTVSRNGTAERESVTAAQDGSWTIPQDTALAAGEYSYTATQTDKAGNVSKASAETLITIHDLTLSGVSSQSAQLSFELTVNGEPNSTVTIVVDQWLSGDFSGQVVLDETGTWIGQPPGGTFHFGRARIDAVYANTVDPPLSASPLIVDFSF